uniref:Uncharacterized protein n=1 Tax=Rhizophora mucronata TaxID=61149 RepID=A0A2P2JR55_RHIMU
MQALTASHATLMTPKH